MKVRPLLRYSILPVLLILLLNKKYQPTTYVHVPQQRAITRKLLTQIGSWPDFVKTSQDETNAACPTTLSLTVQKFAILAYSEASWGGVVSLGGLGGEGMKRGAYISYISRLCYVLLDIFRDCLEHPPPSPLWPNHDTYLEFLCCGRKRVFPQECWFTNLKHNGLVSSSLYATGDYNL